MQALGHGLVRRLPVLRATVAWQPLTLNQTFFKWSYDPFNDVFQQLERTARELDRTMDQMTSNVFRSHKIWPNRLFLPLDSARSLPIEQAPDGTRLYSVRLHLPGFKPEDIEVSLRENALCVRAKQSQGSLESLGSKQSNEQSTSKSSDDTVATTSSQQPIARYVREYTYEHLLPDEVDVVKVTCKLKSDGTLLVHAPLKEPSPSERIEAKEISIKRE